MNEEQDSVGKKSRRSPKWLRAWLLLVVAIFVLLQVMVQFLPGGPKNASEWWIALTVFLAASAVIATILSALWSLMRWLFCERNRKRTLFVLACLATLIALFYAEENWRGQRAWENYQRASAAQGERLDLASIVPPPVPDEKNFAMTPVMVSSYGFILTHEGKLIPAAKRDTNWVNQLEFNLGDNSWKTNGTGHWVNGTMSHLELWQAWYRELATKTNQFAVPPQPQSPAADVLLALGKYAATVEELRQASQLPDCRFPLNYDEENPAMIYLPHLAALKRSSRLLQLRALAELENGQSDQAVADVLLTLRLAGFIQKEPTLIGLLVRMAMTDIALQPVYEGLAKHQWTDAQLVALDVELAKIDYLADFNFAMRSERAFACKITDYVGRQNRYERFRELTEAEGNFEGRTETTDSFPKYIFQRIYFWLMPQGWFAQNKLSIARLHEQSLLRIMEPEKHLAIPQVATDLQSRQLAASPLNIFARLVTPALPNCAIKSARGQSSVDLARVAIALERCRLAHGEFPESLAALAPSFMKQVPHDVIGGQPLKYRRTDDGQFVLYSIGWNQKDDGGVVVFKNGSATDVDFDHGDWVWRYPQK